MHTQTTSLPKLACRLLAVGWLAHFVLSAFSLATAGEAQSPGSNLAGIQSVEIGLDNHYKLGCWTQFKVTLSPEVLSAPSARGEWSPGESLANRSPDTPLGGEAISGGLRVGVTVLDSDGVETTTVAPVVPGAKASPNNTATSAPTAVVFAQVGRVNSPIRIALTRGDQRLDEFVFTTNGGPSRRGGNPPPNGLLATSEYIVSLGSSKCGLDEAFPDRDSSDGQYARKVLNITDPGLLPTSWIGYDGVDALVLSATDEPFCRALAADALRFAALERWIEQGGRLVLFCGAKESRSMLGPGGPLASLAPGKVVDIVRLPETMPIEHFAASPRITGSPIQVPRLEGVRGVIDMYWGGKPTELPLIVRTARVFGEITFVGLDLNQPPLAAWPGRIPLLRGILRPYFPEDMPVGSNPKFGTRGHTDLAGAFRQLLGQGFSGVRSVRFSMVVGLAIAYLCVLGPLDYLIIHRWLRRPRAAWVTFPLILVAFSVLALAAANWAQGRRVVRVNQFEVVDFDSTTQKVRGAYWGIVYSPDVVRMDVALQLPTLRSLEFLRSSSASASAFSEARAEECRLTWWGLPGSGIGGMHTTISDLGMYRSGYDLEAPKQFVSALRGLPILSRSTKSLAARWEASCRAPVSADLRDENGIVAGTLSNDTAIPLSNVRLLYGTWAYRLGTLRAGQRIEISDKLNPRNVKTVITRDVLGSGGSPGSSAGDPLAGQVFAVDRATSREVFQLMMFYQAAGGYGFAHVPFRALLWCDWSRQLELGRAILVADVGDAEAGGPAAKLVEPESNQPLAAGDDCSASVVYRVLLPVGRVGADGTPPFEDRKSSEERNL